MEEFRVIQFQRSRDFSKKLNATFEFIRQNFKPLGKSILLIAGPSVFVGSVMAGSFMGEFFNFGQMAQGNPDAISNYFLSVSFWVQMMLDVCIPNRQFCGCHCHHKLLPDHL